MAMRSLVLEGRYDDDEHGGVDDDDDDVGGGDNASAIFDSKLCLHGTARTSATRSRVVWVDSRNVQTVACIVNCSTRLFY